LLDHLRAAGHLLSPQDLTYSSLTRMEPILTVHLTVGSPKGDLEIRKSWRRNRRNYDCVSTIWSRSHESRDENSTLSLPLIDPTDGLAWELAIRATRAADENNPAAVPPTLRDSVDYALKIDHDPVRDPETEGRCWSSGLNQIRHKKYLQQRQEWRMMIRDSGYVVELARIQDFEYCEPRRPDRLTARCNWGDPRWTLCVFHIDWSNKLSLNWRLQPGSVAHWNVEPDTWFPPDDDHEARMNVLAGRQPAPASTCMGAETMLSKLMTVKELAFGRGGEQQ